MDVRGDVNSSTKSRATRLWLKNRNAKEVAAVKPREKLARELLKPPRGKPAAVSQEMIDMMETAWQTYADRVIPNSQQWNAWGRIELAGSHVIITRSSNPSQVRLEGTVLDESQAMMYIQTRDNRVVQILKEHCHFQIQAKNRTFTIIGSALDRKPAVRTKAKQRKLYSLLD